MIKKENSKAAAQAKRLLSKVPEITLYFWIIKILCTTVAGIWYLEEEIPLPSKLC